MYGYLDWGEEGELVLRFFKLLCGSIANVTY